MPLVAAHAGISWWGTIATQLVVCVVSVQASFALDGLGCPGGPEETWPTRSMCNGVWEYVDMEGYNSSVWFPREWCERCNHNSAVSVIALCFVVLPHTCACCSRLHHAACADAEPSRRRT